jgi:alpha-methylacyl-CoA racemase
MTCNDTARGDARGPLAGVRIVEFVGLGPGPFAAMLLADLGADIVRIDRPGTPELDDTNVVARGRPTIEVDLKDSARAAEILDLLAEADALIEGFRPGVMERLGLGPEIVLRRNPRLVYGRMTGWGQTGPLASSAGHDINYIAITGALAAIGPAERPVPPLNLVGDFGGGSLYLVMGLLAGILSAGRTGRGQVVDCAICDGAASLMSFFSELSAQGRWCDRRESNFLDGGAPYYGVFACRDGLHVSVGALEPQFYRLLREKAGLDDPAFDLRHDETSWPALRAKMAEVFAQRTRAEWCRLLEGTDACFAPVLSLGEAPSHPHMAAREAFVTLGGVTQPAAAPRFSATPGEARPVDGRRLPLSDAVRRWHERPGPDPG